MKSRPSERWGSTIVDEPDTVADLGSHTSNARERAWSRDCVGVISYGRGHVITVGVSCVGVARLQQLCGHSSCEVHQSLVLFWLTLKYKNFW